jgi:ABC-type amino acid transport substrate-binding protein
MRNALPALVMLLLVLCPCAAFAADSGVARAQSVVRVGFESEPGDRRFDYGAELLERALKAAGSTARVERVRGMNQPRMIQAARQGELDVVILPNVRVTDTGLRPIPFPLRRGLLGVRLLLARPETVDRLSRVDSIQTLKSEYTLGYGHGWLDRRELAALGFRIDTANGYRNLFDMLRGGRFDYLSRGVNEIEAELADPALAGRGMDVVPRIALFYPLDDFFFVPANRSALRADIERGLQRMLDDGSYNRLLNARFGEIMRAVRLNERAILHVRGYPVPDGTPLENFDILQPVRSQAVFRDPATLR